MLVDSCIRDLDRIGVSVIRKSSTAGPQEEGRFAVSKFRRAVCMKKAVKDRKGCNITAETKRTENVGKRRAFDSTLFKRDV